MMDALVPKCGHFLSYPSSQTDTTDIPKDLITCVRARETDSECQSFGSLLFPFSSACRNQRKKTSSSSKSSAGAHRRMTDTTGTTGNLKKSFLTREKNDPRSHQSVAHPQSTIYCNRGINDDSEINHKRKPSP